MVQMCQEYGIKHCIVKTIQEAKRTIDYNFDTVLVLYEIPKSIEHSNFTFAINDINDIQKYPKNTNVELKINTGMCRNGINIDEITQAIILLKKYSLNLFGVFTHFACADEINDTTSIQEQKFQTCITQIKQLYTKPFRIHCSNSNGVNKVNNDLYDIARIGIGLYGYVEQFQNELLPVMSLYANKISTRKLVANEKIGYGGVYCVDEQNIYSNYDIGYGDGFFRLNERKKAHVQNGLEILGRVSMDSFTLQSNEYEICVFNNVSHLAKVHDTIEYEILTHLMPTIKREIV